MNLQQRWDRPDPRAELRRTQARRSRAEAERLSAQADALQAKGERMQRAVSHEMVAYRAARATAWSTVPAVFLVTLFAQLGWQQLANLRLVCAAWRSVHDAMVPRLWPRSVFPGMFMGFDRVLSLNLDRCGAWCLEEQLEELCDLPALTQLQLQLGFHPTLDKLQMLQAHPTLTELTLSGFLPRPNDAALSVLNSLPLAKLHLVACPAEMHKVFPCIKDAHVQAAASLTALTTLQLAPGSYLDGRGGLMEVTDAAMRLLSNHAALSALSMERVSKVTEHGWRALASSTSLRSLSLKSSPAASDQSLLTLAGHAPLTQLFLSDTPTVLTAHGIRALRALCDLRRVYLHIDGFVAAAPQ